MILLAGYTSRRRQRCWVELFMIFAARLGKPLRALQVMFTDRMTNGRGWSYGRLSGACGSR